MIFVVSQLIIDDNRAVPTNIATYLCYTLTEYKLLPLVSNSLQMKVFRVEHSKIPVSDVVVAAQHSVSMSSTN